MGILEDDCTCIFTERKGRDCACFGGLRFAHGKGSGEITRRSKVTFVRLVLREATLPSAIEVQ